MLRPHGRTIPAFAGTTVKGSYLQDETLGRQLGDIQIKRLRYPIVKKCKNTAATEKMIA